METVSYEVARIRAREVIQRLQDAGFDASLGNRRQGDTGEAVVDVVDVSDDAVDNLHAIVREHCPDARRL